MDGNPPCYCSYFSHNHWKAKIHLFHSRIISILPDMIVSDSGSVFTSREFENFMKQNGIVHIKASPYHPSTNGLAERPVQAFKSGMKKLREGTLETKLLHFLFHYWLTPQTMMGQFPAELLLGRCIKSWLDLLQPMVKPKVTQSLVQQKPVITNLPNSMSSMWVMKFL